ncbi:polysaccharide pyruvyl transferase family protein [Streptomyces sp. NPDC004327]|uniref:polysaccharide pyruvyl transferase family protein n=1 Tax=Streptomyces sp. NPDC004327 TaxID=3364699 RepID=UPI0036A06D91
MSASVPAFWCRVPSQGNVGDRLTPWLIRRISGAPARWVAPHAPGRKHFVTGSVVALAGPGCVVWGAGVMEAGERVDPRAELLAVRGPLTREAALRSGAACPPVYGDPGLLVPRFLPRRPVRAGGRCVVVPHFADKARARRGVPARWRLVDVQCGVEDVVEQLTGAGLVASSSLHGIVLAHAYGIPAVWIRFRDLPSGDDSKFHDYFLSVGVPVPPPLPVGATGANLDTVAPADFATLPSHLPDLDLLLERCPFR